MNVRRLLVPMTMVLVIIVILTACSAETSPPASSVPVTTQAPAATSAPAPASSIIPAASNTPITSTAPAVTNPPVSVPPASVTPQYGGILRRHASASPSTPIGWPVEAATTGTDAVNQVVLERLLIEQADGSIGPWLAKGYQVAPDKKSITLTLQQGVKFHDGTDFNAEAVKWNLDAHIAAKTSAAATWTSIDVVDEYTVRVNLKEYRNTSVGDLGSLLQVSPTAFEKNGIEWIRWHPVGTGPFKFVSYTRDVILKVEKFADYWQKGKPYLDGIEVHYIADFLTAQMAFKAGYLDVFASENSKMSFDLKNEGYIYGTQLPQCAGTLTLIPDSGNTDSPLANKLVRQAIEYAIDRETICKGLGYGFTTPLYQIAPDQAEIAHIPDLPARKYDIAKARQLLADAGYPNGFKTRIIADPRTTTRDTIVALQSNLAAAGIQVELEFPENAKYTEYRYNGWKNGMLCQLLSNFATYTKCYSQYWLGNQFPSVKLSDEFKTLVLESLATEKMEKEKVQKVTRLIYDESMLIPVNVQVVAWFFSSGLHDAGFFTAHHSYWSPSTAWLEKSAGKK